MMLLLLFFLNAMASASELHLELGENRLLTEKFSKIWIEDKNLMQVQQKANRFFYIKTLKTGISHFRLDNKLTKLIVSPIGAKKSFKEWSLLKNHFVGVDVAYCGEFVCLTGNLYRLRDYIKIIELIKKNNSQVYLALKVNPKIQAELQIFIEQQLRAMGLTPRKLQFTEPWKMSLAKQHPSIRQLGIKTEFHQNTTLLADNIKVAVKVAEVSKNFERKLGVRWPDAYQAQFINSKFNTANEFDLSIAAAEKAGEARILASPNLICRSGKEADFFAGGEFPIKVLGPRSKEVHWKRYGIALKLKPQIDPLGQMSLFIETEVSTLDRSITVDDIPALHTNRVSSFFDLVGRRTIAISGLIKSEVSESTEGLPFLKNLPILGSIFSSKNFQENKSELIIFVTPELME